MPSSIRLETPTTSTGQRTPDSIGNMTKTTLPSKLLTLNSSTLMNSWAPKKDYVLLLLPIDATSHFLKLLVCCMEVPQLVLQEPVRPKLLRIWAEPLVFLWLLPTAQMNTSTETWPRFSRVCAKVDFGDASMNSTEFRLPLSLSLLLK